MKSKSAPIAAIARLTAATALVFASTASAQTTPPDMSVCDDFEACTAPNTICDDGGFTITLTNYTPAPGSGTGAATYTYTICSPAADGQCSDTGGACQDNSDCWGKCTGPSGGKTCNSNGQACTDDSECETASCTGGASTCRTNDFRGLSHADIAFPELGATCLGENTEIKVSCSSPARGDYAGTIGDGSCFSSTAPVAKCDDPQLADGQCLTMTLQIAGELNKPGLGTSVLVDKYATSCDTSCLAGPSCDACVEPPPGDQCLTRTIGFWGNHPWITNDYDPVTVCGDTLGCNGPADAVSNPSCPANSCDSIMEGLCSVPAEYTKNQAYVQMVRQLTAAKLNLNATATLFPGSTCGAWSLGGKTIQQWITYCETLCETGKAAVVASGCIEALDAFNNSEDSINDATPAPFDRPSVDDFGNVSGADPSQCSLAQGNTATKQVLVIDEDASKGAKCEAD